MLTFVVPLLILSVMMIAHELGHFVTAKMAKIRVDEFGLGFPPRLIRLAKRGDTEYTINAIPFGAFVKMAGENEAGVENGFADKGKLTRLAVLVAGSGMNLVVAALFFALAFISGAPSSAETKHAMVLRVEEASPAQSVGIQAGDVIVEADGVEILSAAQLSEYVREKAGQEVTLTVRRGEEFLQVRVVPRQPAPNQGALGIGITEETTRIELTYSPPLEALYLGAKEVVSTIGFTLSLPVLLIRQTLAPELARPVGPVGIFQITGSAATQTVETGWWYPLLRLIGVLGVALGITNLLPLPALDGGRILFILFEAIRGKRVDPQKEGIVHWVGLMMLLVLMVVITYQDIVSPVPSFQLPNPF
jgi:regulator of sigma E protease